MTRFELCLQHALLPDRSRASIRIAEVACDLATYAAARALGLRDYGLRIGARADLVVVPAQHVPEAVVARPPRRYVIKAGRIVARDGRYLAQ